jgi:uncharacterized membrane protein YhaH (DUF805 family)
MDFSQAVQTCIRKYADFNGRAARPEYWWFFLFLLVVGVLLRFASPLLALVFHLAMLVPSLAAGARRLHDTNRSGWWQLVWLVPLIGWIVMIVFLAQEGTRESNAYGTPPGEAAMAV